MTRRKRGDVDSIFGISSSALGSSSDMVRSTHVDSGIILLLFLCLMWERVSRGIYEDATIDVHQPANHGMLGGSWFNFVFIEGR